jgi:signal transduction histidine kinase
LQAEIRLDEEAILLAPPSHVEMAIRNLIDNAVKYAAPDGELRIGLRKSEKGFRLDFFNACDPPTEWDAEKLFEPF